MASAAMAAAGSLAVPAMAKLASDDLQAAIDEAIRSGTPLNLPHGVYLVRQTLKINAAVGLEINGAGGNYALPDWEMGGWKNSSTRTLLLWDGPDGGTLLEINSANGCTFRNMGLCGINRPDTSSQAGRLIHCQSRPGWSNAGHHFENICLSHAMIGMQFGSNSDDITCSDTSLYRVRFSDCMTGFKAVTRQAVNFYFDQVEGAGKIDVLVHFNRGGDLRWDGGAGTISGQPTILRIDSAGENASTFALRGMRFETNGGWPIIVDAPGNAGSTTISIRDLSDADSNQKLICNLQPGMFRIGPGVGLTINNSTLRRHIGILSGAPDRQATLTMDNCVLAGQHAADLITLGDNSYYRARDCRMLPSNRPIPTEGNWPQ